MERKDEVIVVKEDDSSIDDAFDFDETFMKELEDKELDELKNKFEYSPIKALSTLQDLLSSFHGHNQRKWKRMKEDIENQLWMIFRQYRNMVKRELIQSEKPIQIIKRGLFFDIDM